MALSLLFLESNSPRNISFYAFLKFFIAGAVLAMVFTGVLAGMNPSLVNGLGASGAALVEEPAKLAAVVLLARSITSRWSINGLALGAVVGAGFAAFETAGYAFVFFLESNGDISTMSDVLLLRAWSSLGSHVMWTAVAAAALWTVMRGTAFEWGMLVSKRFLTPFLAVVGLHFMWNSGWVEDLGVPAYLALIAMGAWLALASLIHGAHEYAAEGRVSETDQSTSNEYEVIS